MYIKSLPIYVTWSIFYNIHSKKNEKKKYCKEVSHSHIYIYIQLCLVLCKNAQFFLRNFHRFEKLFKNKNKMQLPRR